MGEPTLPQPALLVVGLLAGSRELVFEAEQLLVSDFGEVGVRSDIIRFDFSDYYEQEMGRDVVRRWLGFQRTVEPGRLAEVKLACNSMERTLATAGPGPCRGGRRRVNIDPGLLSLHNLVLASTKEFAHRVYLGHGIHAEVTLIYLSGRFVPQEWTYSDYRTEECLAFMQRCRGLLTRRSPKA
ncbi:MAG: DUF4416 family protein [candidate division WOR-3 bacterium]|nr:MAG: DUF4416 family protein [candidate division WOR-3 bacterium]